MTLLIYYDVQRRRMLTVYPRCRQGLFSIYTEHILTVLIIHVRLQTSYITTIDVNDPNASLAEVHVPVERKGKG
jgi:hypothetical protein